jgi:hypothetical protein
MSVRCVDATHGSRARKKLQVMGEMVK